MEWYHYVLLISAIVFGLIVVYIVLRNIGMPKIPYISNIMDPLLTIPFQIAIHKAIKYKEDINPIWHNRLEEKYHNEDWNAIYMSKPVKQSDRAKILRSGRFYHMTDKKNLNIVLKDGLITKGGKRILGGGDLIHGQPSIVNGTYVYVDDLETTISSSGMLIDNDIDPVIFDIRMRTFDGRIYYDEDNLHGLEYNNEFKKNRTIPISTCALAGDIKPSKIKGYWELDRSQSYTTEVENSTRDIENGKAVYYKYKYHRITR